MTSEEKVIIDALEDMPVDRVFKFLNKQSENNILGVIAQIRSSSPKELRAKVETEFLVKSSIEAAEEFRRGTQPNHVSPNIQKILGVSVELLKKQIKNNLASLENVAEYCLRVYDLLNINDDNRGSANTLLRDCGARLCLEELRKVRSKVNAWVSDDEKRPTVRNLLCVSYLEQNYAAESALVALERGASTACLKHHTTPEWGTIDNLKKEMLLVDANDGNSVDRASALFSQACHFPGPEEARAAVLSVRSDLAGLFTDDTSTTVGKKAE
jgi:hypothetical protein